MTPITSTRFAPPSRTWLTRRQVAELIGVTVHCVEKWAERKQGPKFYRTSRFAQGRAAYRIEDVEDFLRQRRGAGSYSLSACAADYGGSPPDERPV